MSAPYRFTPDDRMSPVYCLQCRAHIPRLASAQQGICQDCIAQNRQAGAAKAAVPFAGVQGSQSAVPTQVPPSSRNFVPYFIFCMLFSVLLAIGSLAWYHKSVVEPLQDQLAITRKDLFVSQSQIKNASLRLSAASRELQQSQFESVRYRAAADTAQEHLNRLQATSGQNSAATDSKNGY